MIYSLPNDRKLDWSKLKANADDILKIMKMIISLFDRVENTMGKGGRGRVSVNKHVTSTVMYTSKLTPYAVKRQKIG